MDEAGEVIKKGGLVAFPTETVYGLGGNALDEAAAGKIYRAKGRPSDNPLIVHICRLEDIYPIVKEVPEAALKLADAFWPGPLTMILRKSDKVPYATTGGLDTVAVRMPGHKRRWLYRGSRRIRSSPQRQYVWEAEPYFGKVCNRRFGRQDRYDY